MSCDEMASLGAYVIDALGPEERAQVDAHLLHCAICRAELADLAALVPILDKLSLDDVEEVEPLPVVSESLYDRVAALAAAEDKGGADVLQIRRRPRWQALAAAAAAVVVIGGASVTAVEVLRSSSSGAETRSAAHGLVHMRVTVASQATGTALRVAVSGLPSDEHCRLFAVANDGTTDLVGQWPATYAGEAQVTGSTSIATADLAKLVLMGNHNHWLVTVPV